jgi:hypothetical protein
MCGALFPFLRISSYRYAYFSTGSALPLRHGNRVYEKHHFFPVKFIFGMSGLKFICYCYVERNG